MSEHTMNDTRTCQKCTDETKLIARIASIAVQLSMLRERRLNLALSHFDEPERTTREQTFAWLDIHLSRRLDKLNAALSEVNPVLALQTWKYDGSGHEITKIYPVLFLDKGGTGTVSFNLDKAPELLSRLVRYYILSSEIDSDGVFPFAALEKYGAEVKNEPLVQTGERLFNELKQHKAVIESMITLDDQTPFEEKISEMLKKRSEI